MVDITFLEKINLIFNFLKKNSIVLLIILLVVIIIMDLLYGRNSKSTKRLYVIIIALLVIFSLFVYYKPLLNIIDVYIANIFRITYFPSIVEYVTMLSITLIIQVVSCIRNKKVVKHINIWVGIILEILFIVNLIAMNNIRVDLNTLTSIYENNLLLAIFQLSSIIFVIWILLNLIVYIISLFLNKKLELPKLKKEFY